MWGCVRNRMSDISAKGKFNFSLILVGNGSFQIGV